MEASSKVHKYDKGQVLKSRGKEHIYIENVLDIPSPEPQYTISYYSSSPDEEFISSSVVSESTIDEQTVNSQVRDGVVGQLV